jgi:hypothetical protein
MVGFKDRIVCPSWSLRRVVEKPAMSHRQGRAQAAATSPTLHRRKEARTRTFSSGLLYPEVIVGASLLHQTMVSIMMKGTPRLPLVLRSVGARPNLHGWRVRSPNLNHPSQHQRHATASPVGWQILPKPRLSVRVLISHPSPLKKRIRGLGRRAKHHSDRACSNAQIREI